MNTVAQNLKHLSGIWGIEVKQILSKPKYKNYPRPDGKVCRAISDRSLTFIFADGKRIKLDGIRFVMSKPRFNNAMAKAGIKPLIPIDDWDRTAQMILDACDAPIEEAA